MKKVKMALLAMVCAGLSSKAQLTMPDHRLQWTTAGTQVQMAEKHTLDSLFAQLPPGGEQRIRLLRADEGELNESELAARTYQRGTALLAYCREQRRAEQEMELEMVPFHEPNRIRTSLVKSRAYTTFMAKRSETFLVIHGVVDGGPTEPAVSFDPDTRGDEQVYMFTADQDAYLYLPGGSVFFIPANTLVASGNARPECEKVELHVAEYVREEAMLLKAMTTTSSGKKLQTGGMWHVSFECNGKELRPAPGKFYYIRVGFTGEPKNMKVFTGQSKKGLLDWYQQSDGKVSVVNAYENFEAEQESSEENDNDVFEGEFEGEGVYQEDMYELKLNDVGWINCDAFYEVSNKTDLVVQCDTAGRVNAMLYFAQKRSILPGYLNRKSGSIRFTEIPADEPALLVVFRKTGKDQVEKFTQVVYPGKDKNISVTYSASSFLTLRSELKGKMDDL